MVEFDRPSLSGFVDLDHKFPRQVAVRPGSDRRRELDCVVKADSTAAGLENPVVRATDVKRHAHKGGVTPRAILSIRVRHA